MQSQGIVASSHYIRPWPSRPLAQQALAQQTLAQQTLALRPAFRQAHAPLPSTEDAGPRFNTRGGH